MTNHSIPKPNQSNRIDEKVHGNLKDILELVETFEFAKFFELTEETFNEESADNKMKDDISYTL